MDISLLIRQRLTKLGLGQKELAAAAGVTESYISQLLGRKKPPPSPGRTEIYEKIGRALKLPSGELSMLAETQRREQLRKRVAEAPRALFPAARDLILRRCETARRKEVQRIFQKEPFGELERLVAQTLLQVALTVAGVREAGIFDLSAEACTSYLNPAIQAWDIDLATFAISVSPARRVRPPGVRRFAFAEQVQPAAPEPALEEFLNDPALSGDATPDEITFLKSLNLLGRRPSPIYYYRELQNLRDPLHFPSAS